MLEDTETNITLEEVTQEFVETQNYPAPDANVTLPNYPRIAVGILQLLNSAAVGYNLGVAIEICEACLPEETKHIQRGAYVSLAFMAAALIMDCCCLPFICKGNNNVSKAIAKKCQLPSSMITSLPTILMFVANLIILIYIAAIHGQYHALFDNVSVIAPLVVGIFLGIGFCGFSVARSCHTDAHTYVTKPEGLLELLEERKQSTNDQIINLGRLRTKDTANHKNTQWGSFFRQAPVGTSTVTVNLRYPADSILGEDTGNEDSRDDLLTQMNKS